MSKADELAQSYCAECGKKDCSVPCSKVLVPLFMEQRKSPHELQEMMKNARRRAGI